MKIEQADKSSLNAIFDVIEDSILNLCHEDHLNKREHLDAWLSERSMENLEKTLFSDTSQGFVCIVHERIVGVSLIDSSGELKLCYVRSQFAGKGIGRLLLEASEQQANIWGLNEIRMVSTGTAKKFYLSHGYKENGKEVVCIGMPGYPLSKKLHDLHKTSAKT